MKIQTAFTPVSKFKPVAEARALSILCSMFEGQMFERLMEKMKEGYSGWDDPHQLQVYETKGRINQAVDEERWVDAANLCMFMWNREK